MSPQNSVSEPEQRVPLLLLHSSMSSKAQWTRLEQGLPPHYQAIPLDLYGYGDAPFPDDAENFSLAREAARVGQLADQLIGALPFHLVGHSYGAATALRYAYDNPNRLLSIGLFEPVAFHLLPPGDEAVSRMQAVGEAVNESLAAGDAATATRHFIDFWSGSGTYERMDRARQQLMAHYIRKVALDFQALFNEPLTASDYRAIETPTCLLWSPQSPSPTRRVAALLQETLSRIESHSVPGGHMAPITNPDQVNPHWIRFLQQHQND